MFRWWELNGQVLNLCSGHTAYAGSLCEHTPLWQTVRKLGLSTYFYQLALQSDVVLIPAAAVKPGLVLCHHCQIRTLERNTAFQTIVFLHHVLSLVTVGSLAKACLESYCIFAELSM